MSRTDVAVVGAGITGLALRRELERLGVGCLVLEAADRPGGVIRTRRVDGRVLEVGPQRTRLVEPVRRLVSSLGLEDRLLRAEGDLPLWIYADGRLRRVPFSPGAFLTTDLFSWAGRLRMLLEPLTGPAREGETVEEFVTRKLGREAYERLVGPLYGGIYGSDPRDMLMRHTLGPALETVGMEEGSLLVAAARWMLSGDPAPPPATFEDGMEEMIEALREEAGDRVRLAEPVEEVRPSGDGWSVRTAGGSVRAEAVVLTCPADAAASILAGTAPEAAARLARIRYNPLAMVHLRADGALEGYGYQVVASEGFVTRGVTFNESLFGPGHGREGVYTAYLGGATAPKAVEDPDEQIAGTAVEEFRRVTGLEAEVLHVERTRMAAWDRSRAALEEMTLPDGIELCASYESRAGIPGRLAEARRTAEELAARPGGTRDYGGEPPPAESGPRTLTT